MKTPRLPSRPKRTGNAAFPTSAVRAKVGPVILKMSLTRPMIANAANELSMIVTTTSWAPVNALRAPGMNPYSAPPRAPARMATGTAISGGCCATREPTSAAKNAADEDLPGPADVEQPRLEADPHGEPGEDQRSRRNQRVGEGLRAGYQRECERSDAVVVDVEERDPGGSLEQRFVCLDREQQVEVSLGGRARQDDQDRTGEQRQQDRDDRDDRERVGLPGGLHEGSFPSSLGGDAVPPWASCRSAVIEVVASASAA